MAPTTVFPSLRAAVRPEDYGPIGQGADGAAINAAISAVANSTALGDVLLSQAYNLEQPVVLQTGVNLLGTGQGNRQNYPDTFLGGVLQPSGSFPASTPLVRAGSAGSPTTNPCGARIRGVCFNGMTAAAVTVTGCTGLAVADTSDLHVLDSFFGNFDRTGSTGTCISLSSATAGNGYGFQMHNTVLSASSWGLYADGAGTTDMRITGNLFHSNNYGATIGPTAGGGGLQLNANHWVYTGAGSGMYHLSMGSQSGDYAITGEYWDKGGAANVVVLLATAKGIFSNCHFLASGSSTATSLVKLSTANQEISFSGNNCNLNGGSIKALFQTSAHSGTPTGGIYVGNSLYGSYGTAPTAVLIDSGASAINDFTTAGTGNCYVAGNRVFT